jgi:hypothetical protein
MHRTVGYINKVRYFVEKINLNLYQDVDIETSYGWIECIGIADRSAYDLVQHATVNIFFVYKKRQYVL